jgi:hypothetical protein
MATPKFKVWLSKRMYEIHHGESIEDKVDKMMAPENISTQIKDENGRWHEVEITELSDDE